MAHRLGIFRFKKVPDPTAIGSLGILNRAAGQAREAKIDDADSTIDPHQHVAGVYVGMNHLLGVQTGVGFDNRAAMIE